MGGAAVKNSAPASILETGDALTPTEIKVLATQELNTQVLAIGRVAAVDKVIIPPFGPDASVMIEAKAFRVAEGKQRNKKNELLFTALCAVNFKICDEQGQEILVDVSGLSDWNCRMLESYVAMNVARDSAKKGMVSGGTHNHQWAQQELRPHAEAFWKEFSNGASSWDSVKDMTENRQTSILQGGASRDHEILAKVKEFSVKVGDAVLVAGTLMNGKDGLCIKGGGGAAITNNSKVAKRLASLRAFKVPSSANSPSRVPMSQTIGSSSSPTDVYDFASIDLDGDQKISLSELTMVFQKLGAKHCLSAGDIEKLFKAIDTDNSGSVDPKEFADFLTGGEQFVEKSEHYLAEHADD